MHALRFFSHKFPVPSNPEEVEKARKHTLSLSVLEGSVWSLMAGFGDAFIAPFAIFLKAGNQAIALLSTMPALVGALSQMAGASMTDRLKRRRALIVPFVVCQALSYIPLVFVPFLFPDLAIPAVIAFTLVGVICGNAVAPAWTSMMGDVVPETTRGDYFGHRGRMVILMVFLSTISAGATMFFFQNQHRIWTGFFILFAVAALARLLSARLLALHYDPHYHPSHDSYFTFWDFIRRMPQSNFARFALFNALMSGAINVAGPFFNVYMLRDLHWTYAQFTINAAIFQATQFLFIRWWGRIGDRHGNRVILEATSYIMPLLPILWTFSTRYLYLLCVQMVSGMVWAGFSIATLNFTFDAVTPHKRARVSAYVSILNGVFTLIGGTLLGAYLANHLPSTFQVGPYKASFISPLPAVFLVSSMLRLLVVLVMLPHFKEVRAAEKIHPAMLLRRVAGGEPLAGFFSQSWTRFLPGKR
ncbi:MAG: MFS transporter, partial [Lentisphaerota bacterium]